MAAGLSSAAKYGRTVRALNRVERLLIELRPLGCEVIRKGYSGSVVIEPIADRSKGFSVCVRWGNASNGESLGCYVIAGKPFWYGYGNLKETLEKHIQQFC